MLKNHSKIYDISAKITNDEKEKIFYFIQGAVYSYCKNCHGKSFAARDLFGGENADWTGTPLEVLYNWHMNNGSNNPVNSAGKDVGKLLKSVVENDERLFNNFKDYVNYYEWIV